MTQFTDSPYERMMTQNHLSGREARLPPAPPSDSLWPGRTVPGHLLPKTDEKG